MFALNCIKRYPIVLTLFFWSLISKGKKLALPRTEQFFGYKDHSLASFNIDSVKTRNMYLTATGSTDYQRHVIIRENKKRNQLTHFQWPLSMYKPYFFMLRKFSCPYFERPPPLPTNLNFIRTYAVSPRTRMSYTFTKADILSSSRGSAIVYNK